MAKGTLADVKLRNWRWAYIHIIQRPSLNPQEETKRIKAKQKTKDVTKTPEVRVMCSEVLEERTTCQEMQVTSRSQKRKKIDFPQKKQLCRHSDFGF